MPPTSAASPSTGGRRSPGFERYFHPFASMLDNLTMTQFVHNVEARDQAARTCTRIRIASSSPRGSRPAARRPKAARELPVRYLARLPLRRDAARAVPAQEGTRARRALQSLPRDARDPRCRGRDRVGQDPGGRDDRADLFVDCTGFAGLLIDKALKTPFVSFASNLFNDAAVAMPSPIDGPDSVARRCPPPSSTAGPGRFRSPAATATAMSTARNSARRMQPKPSCANASVCSIPTCRRGT